VRQYRYGKTAGRRGAAPKANRKSITDQPRALPAGTRTGNSNLGSPGTPALNNLLSAESGGPMLVAAPCQPGPDSVSCMCRGVIFGSGDSWAAAVAFMRGEDKGNGSNLPGERKRLLVPPGPGRAGQQRSSDRVLTVGADVAGLHAAPLAGPERQPGAVSVGSCHLLGMDHHLLLGSRRDGLSDRRCRRPRLEPGRRLPSACRRSWPGGEPRELQMVRRRSTVRFRKGAPGQKPDSIVQHAVVGTTVGTNGKPLNGGVISRLSLAHHAELARSRP
jgi:hypothetical protein